MKKDWVGNKKSTFITLGASNHSDGDREPNDYYATDPIAAEWLIKIERLNNSILEPACGEGHLAEVFKDNMFTVTASDLIPRGYGNTPKDFFSYEMWEGDIVTNPPYSFGIEFIQHAISIVQLGAKVCMFMKVQFLEGQKRGKFFQEFPPHTVHVTSSRIKCAINGDFNRVSEKSGKIESSAAAYAWYVWVKGYQGPTFLKWFNL